MKKFIAIVFVSFIANFANAQEDDFRTIFGNSDGETSISGFGAVTLDFGIINQEFGLIMGGEGAVLFNRSFYVGAYGRGLTTLSNYNYYQYSYVLQRNVLISQQASFGHGGLLIGSVFYPTNPIHFGASLKVGMGGIGLFDKNYDNAFNSENYKSAGPFYVLTPQADFEMNMTNWFKFRASIGYQWVSQASIKYQTSENGSIITKEVLNAQEFKTPTFSLGFVFGWFK